MTGADSRLQAILDLRHHPVVRRLGEVAGAVSVHLVGGVVRDAWLGRPTRDVDVVVAGEGRRIAERLAERFPARLVLLGGEEFAAYRLVGEGFVVDVWDREEASLGDDLARRDFTVNAIALEVGEGEAGAERLVDPFGGLEDLAARSLRATTEESFASDPLRVLRLPRFLVELAGFSAEPGTVVLAARAAPELGGVATERIREELERILVSDRAPAGFSVMPEIGLWPGLFLGRPGQEGSPGGVEALLGELEALPTLRFELETLARREGLAPPRFEGTTARLAGLGDHLGGERPGAMLTRLADRGLVTRRAAARAGIVAQETTLPEGALGQRRFVHRTGELWATALVALGARLVARQDSDWGMRAQRLVRRVRDEGRWLLDTPRLVDGGEVQGILGIGPGPEVGRALEALEAAVVDGRVRDREAALSFVRGLGGS